MQVDLALNILDGAPFREDPKQVIRVQRAKFEQKGQDYVPKKKAKSKKKAAGVLSKQEKELGWGGFDDKLAANKVSFAACSYDCGSFQEHTASLPQHSIALWLRAEPSTAVLGAESGGEACLCR